MGEIKSSVAAAAEVQQFIKARRRAENQSDVEAECVDGARERSTPSLRLFTLHQVLGLCSMLFITVVTTIIILFKSIFNKDFLRDVSTALQQRIMTRIEGERNEKM